MKKGATVILEIEVYITGTSTLVDPATSMTVTITNHRNGIEVENEPMIGGYPPVENTGKYHYDFQSTASMETGRYDVIYTDTDGSRVSHGIGSFNLE